jgi:hypothetical protein
VRVPQSGELRSIVWRERTASSFILS